MYTETFYELPSLHTMLLNPLSQRHFKSILQKPEDLPKGVYSNFISRMVMVEAAKVVFVVAVAPNAPSMANFCT
jgi:hypothetical protein